MRSAHEPTAPPTAAVLVLASFMNIKNKVALVTGASRGIGRAIALELAREGCHIAVTARDGAALAEVASSARGLGVKAAAIPLDLGKQENVAALVDRGNHVGADKFIA